MKFSTIFRNRWMAVLWSAGIIWFALDVAGEPAPANQASPVTDATGAAVDADQAKALGAILAAP